MEQLEELIPPELARYKRWAGAQTSNVSPKKPRIEVPSGLTPSPAGKLHTPGTSSGGGSPCVPSPAASLPLSVMQALGAKPVSAVQNTGIIPLSAAAAHAAQSSGSTPGSGPHLALVVFGQVRNRNFGSDMGRGMLKRRGIMWGVMG